jgi:predicted HD superfamily hydrolase involved in NAD metabolism
MDGYGYDQLIVKYDRYVDIVRKRLNPKRFSHTLGVVRLALELAEAHGQNCEHAFLAALFHDYSKYIPHDEAIEKSKKYGIEIDGIMLRNPSLIHGALAAEELKEDIGIDDEHILDAIRYHTYGREHMRTLDKIIYIADAVEPGRIYDGIDEVRKLLGINLDKALVASVDDTIRYVVSKGEYLHVNSILMRNRLIFESTLRL